MNRPPYGELLRAWRAARNLSQLAMADAAGVSPRHLSCLETGRARPSRDMVLLLCDVLDVPLRERNAFMAAAGYAPVFRESDLDAPEMAPIRRSLHFLLQRHEPYPAVVIDGGWNVLLTNVAAARLVALLVPSLPAPLNGMRILYADWGVRPYIVNFEEVAAAMAKRLHREAIATGRAEPRMLLEEARAAGAVPRDANFDVREPPSPTAYMHIEKDGLCLRLFSVLTTLGTPIDVTAQECRLETFFPADAESDAALHALAT